MKEEYITPRVALYAPTLESLLLVTTMGFGGDASPGDIGEAKKNGQFDFEEEEECDEDDLWSEALACVPNLWE